MKRTILTILTFVAGITTGMAIDANTVEINYNGNTATVTIASNISSYVTVSSGNSSHVKLVQSASFAGINPTTDNTDGEIIYVLSGTSTNGEFYLEGSFKCNVQLNALTLTNPSGPAINIQNGKRVEVTLKKGTTSTIADGTNEEYNGCYHCKGHTKFRGRGTLNVVGNSKHAIYSKEYIEIKNSTINITSAVKDGIHCKEYFFMESGTVNISSALDDGIQVELSSDPETGETADHEDENTGNFYMEGGTLTIANYTGKAIKTDGTITYSGGTRNFNTGDTLIHAGISSLTGNHLQVESIFDLSGRMSDGHAAGMYIVRRNGKTVKKIVR